MKFFLSENENRRVKRETFVMKVKLRECRVSLIEEEREEKQIFGEEKNFLFGEEKVTESYLGK